MSAALIGSGVGLSLGAAYLAGGMAQHAADHSRVERIAMAAAGGYSDAMLQDANVLRLAQQPSGSAQARQLAQLTERLENQQGDRKVSAQRDLECLTQAVYYEARGESPQGQFAVAQVVMNRVKHPAFPKTVCGVVFQGSGRRTGCQFSFACDGSMRGGHETSAWQRARKVASRVLAGAAVADVGSATHFHTTAVAPAWGPQMRRVAQVGMHVFYKFNPRGVMQAAAQAPLQPAVLTSGLPEAPIEYRLTNVVVVEKPAEVPHAASAEGAASAAEAKPAQAAPAKGGADSAALKGSPASAVASAPRRLLGRTAACGGA
ncbi:cell wall hydrolase [Phenylobacterium sp. J426]|uniref:cell wall hydrolase n=1 Tax=Phenylobacterium sp. J426 TaxID=2898439 RepID=UPI002151D876|nr:cell wall hydrolase [Phenylobacterium sp. J426]MCR5872874.1 cell wall hydrolase [Phenylobacterium sp. J426]